jgi:uncharacterized protein
MGCSLSNRPEITQSLPLSSFRLKLCRRLPEGEEIRWANYDPYSSLLEWADGSGPLIAGSQAQPLREFSFLPVSPENPGLKSRNLKLIKVQVGFGCNFSCNYCSQKSFRPTTGIGGDADAQAFLRGISSWYEGGNDGKGQGTRVDFLGGETLLYWKLVLRLARGLKEIYPNIGLSLYTNGSVEVAELAEEAVNLGIQIMLSHDGHTQKKNRGLDPFENPTNLAFLRDLARRLLPHQLFAVQMTMGKHDFRLEENRALIASALDLPAQFLPIVYDIVYALDSEGSTMTPTSPAELAAFQGRILGEFRKIGWAGALAFKNFRKDLVDILDPLLGRSSMADAGQRCGMDQATSIAVDLKGNVLTCQNTTARGVHRIGHVTAFEEIRLNTAAHWSRRESCRNCPVVALCKGGCMYTEGAAFEKTCDSMFAYYSSVLAFALENLIGWRLQAIEGENLRARGLDKITISEG